METSHNTIERLSAPACSALDVDLMDSRMEGYNDAHKYERMHNLAKKLERERNELMTRITEWSNLTNDAMRLRCGEITAQEIRTVRAVLAALSHNTQDHPPQAG